MDLPTKLLEQIAFNTRPKIEEHMLIVMDKVIHEEHLSHPLQTNIKQFKIAVTFLTGYNGIFIVTISSNKFYFKKKLIEEDFIQITFPQGHYGIQSLNDEIKKIIIDKGHYSKDDFPFTIEPNFSSLGSIIEIKPQRAIIGFVYDDSVRNFLGFHEIMLFKVYNLSQNPVDILSFENVFLECDIAKGLIFISKEIRNIS